MQKFSTWMIISLAIVFWIVRIIATYTTAMGMEFFIKPLEINTEIMLLFIALLAFILIIKRKFLGVLIYMIGYFGYFGYSLFQNIIQLQAGIPVTNDYMNMLIELGGIALPLLVLFDWLLDKNKQIHPKDKKTDWFYKNEKYNVKKDDREDKNNYRTL